MCVVLALFLCRVACFCSVKVGLWGLECAPLNQNAHLQKDLASVHSVSLHEHEYLRRFREFNNSLFSSISKHILARDRPNYCCTDSLIARAHTHTHTHTR